MSEFLRVERRGAVATLWIDRQPKMNTMTVAMRNEFPGLFAGLEADESVRVVVIRGAGGKAFSAGGDVAEFLTLAPADLELWGDTLTSAERCRKPVHRRDRRLHHGRRASSWRWRATSASPRSAPSSRFPRSGSA